MDVFSFFKTVLPWELSTGPPQLERETRIHETPIPVPTGITTSSWAGKEGTLLQGKIRILCKRTELDTRYGTI
jgi:hypothetical protein